MSAHHIRTLTLLPLLLLAACGGDQNPIHTDVELLVVSGDAQSGPVGAELAGPVVARLVDGSGNPVEGQAVTFKVTSGGGSVFAGTGTTNAQGEVRERWTLGLHTAEAQTLEARMVDSSTGEARVLGTFSATPLPLAAHALQAGEAAAGPAGGSATSVARVVDVHGNRVPGVSVAWSRLDGALVPRAETSLTDAQGEAHMAWTLPERVESAQVEARWGEQAVQLSVVTTSDVPVRLEAEYTDSIGGLPGGQPVLAPNVTAYDRFGNLAADAPITLRVVEGGGRVMENPQSSTGAELPELTVRTDTQGQLTGPYWARRTQGYRNFWRLGAEGRNVLAASAPGTNEVVFTADARSPFLHIESVTETKLSGYFCWEEDWVSAFPAVRVGGLTPEAYYENIRGTSNERPCGIGASYTLETQPPGPLAVTLTSRHPDGRTVTVSTTLNR